MARSYQVVSYSQHRVAIGANHMASCWLVQEAEKLSWPFTRCSLFSTINTTWLLLQRQEIMMLGDMTMGNAAAGSCTKVAVPSGSRKKEKSLVGQQKKEPTAIIKTFSGEHGLKPWLEFQIAPSSMPE